MSAEDPYSYYPRRPGAQLRRWVLFGATVLLGLIVLKTLGREAAPGDGMWVVFRWPILAIAVVGGPLLAWRLLRRRDRGSEPDRNGSGTQEP